MSWCTAHLVEGGDGTVAEVGQVLLDKNLPMGIIPLGTTNALAQGAGEPDPYDGYLDLTIIRETEQPLRAITTLATSGASACNMKPEDVDDVKAENDVLHLQCSELVIEAENAFDYAIDGELASANKLKLSVLPAALTIYC